MLNRSKPLVLGDPPLFAVILTMTAFGVAMVYSAGGYSFTDFVKVGVPIGLLEDRHCGRGAIGDEERVACPRSDFAFHSLHTILHHDVRPGLGRVRLRRGRNLVGTSRCDQHRGRKEGEDTLGCHADLQAGW